MVLAAAVVVLVLVGVGVGGGGVGVDVGGCWWLVVGGVGVGAQERGGRSSVHTGRCGTYNIIAWTCVHERGTENRVQSW